MPLDSLKVMDVSPGRKPSNERPGVGGGDKRNREEIRARE